MKYKVGDRVRIVEKWNEETCQSCFGGMDKWLGKVMTIIGLDSDHYHMKEDIVWCWNDACIAGLADESDDKQKIVITTDGKETLARLYNGKNVVESATAKCHPNDTFDFKEGAKIAMERLMGEDKPAAKTEYKRTEKPKFEVGRYYECKDPMYTPHRSGIIKITKIENGRAYYDRIEGMEEDFTSNFQIGSIFADGLNPIDYQPKTNDKVGNIYNKEESKPTYYNGKVKCVKSGYPWFTVGKVYDVVDGKITSDEGDVYPRKGEHYVDAEDVKHAGCLAEDGMRHNHRNEFIPYVEETPAPETPENTEWRVVNRDPVVGDYIRLVKSNVPRYTFDSDGDILKVDGFDNGTAYVLGKNHKRSEPDTRGISAERKWNYSRDEFEVVEPVNDEPEKPVDKKYAFNVGDRVKHRKYGKGIVININVNGNFGVEFAKGIGHDCEGITLVAGAVGIKGTSHWCIDNELKLIEKKSEFVPYLSHGTTRYGNIGEPTNYKDAIGRPLCVGDTVELYNDKQEYRGEKTVSHDDYDGVFIMGIACDCDSKTGSTGDWKIIKKRSFEDVKDGEKVDDIEYIKTERKR